MQTRPAKTKTQIKIRVRVIAALIALFLIISAASVWAAAAGSRKKGSFYFFGGRMTVTPACVLNPSGTACPNCPFCTVALKSACGAGMDVKTAIGGGFCHVPAIPYVSGTIPQSGGMAIGLGLKPDMIVVMGGHTLAPAPKTK